MILQLVGLIVIVSALVYGVYKVATTFTIKDTVNRYEYKETKDEEGNTITQVIDLNNKESE